MAMRQTYSLAEAAVILGVREITVWRMVKTNRLEKCGAHVSAESVHRAALEKCGRAADASVTFIGKNS